jgi:hypothetical protein
MRGFLAVALVGVLAGLVLPQTTPAQAFKLAPAVAIEAEDFTIESGWKVIRNGHGNYMVDIIGFNHISGERLLGIDAKNDSASAYTDVQVPTAGKYRLWVRYEYPAFCETRFRVIVEQGGKLLDHVMGKKDNLRYGFGHPTPKAQHDPSWGSEGLFEEVVTLAHLKAGKARIYLNGVTQPQTPGVAANRNIDLLYLTSDTADAWMKHYRKTTNLYPLLDAFRDTRGPRWQVRFTNRSGKKADFRIAHVYNRIPWGYGDPASVLALDAGKTSDWVGLLGQDTAHFSLVRFTSSAGPFDVELRPPGGKDALRKLSGDSPLQAYLPPYPGKNETPTTPEEAIDAILAELKKTPPPGKKPTRPLCYGGWMPLGQDNAYGRKYAELYAALGFRSLHPANSGPEQVKNLKAAGVPLSQSWMVMGYRNPPTKANIERARQDLGRTGLAKQLRFFDYGDEIAFSEWFSMLVDDEIAKSKARGKPLSAAEVVGLRWLEWLKANRPKSRPVDYWLKAWGPFRLGGLRPDSSAAAAVGNPRLYVDSLLFYEDSAIHFAAEGAKAVRSAFGQDVLCGANYSGHPFYYPHSTMYIKWFRGGAADMGRHSEYFWQVCQPGPMVNGYFSEHFRAGMRDNPRAVLRQYTMPHSPGNTDANFLRSVFSHLAHGAKMLDFFGIGLNETFTENHIDHRDRARFRCLRDVTHCVGLVEDLLPASHAVPSEVALLVSESTERWDLAGIATDRAGHNPFGPDFRKTRLHFHLERLGLWKALTFLGSTPDLLIEEDINAKVLKGYKVLVLVGDHWPAALVAAVEAWVKAGGVALSTAAAGLRDPYGEKSELWHKLAGLKNVQTEQRTTFLRPRQELPFLAPLATVVGKGWKMPALATKERAEPAAETTVLARFDDKSPAVFERKLGKGRIIYVAAHPGLAYLWSALQPPAVPDRGPGTHTIPTKWDAGARALLAGVLKMAHVEPAIVARPELIDARLLEAQDGYILPVANYHDKVGQKVTIAVRTKKKVTKAISAYHGALPVKSEDGRVTLTIPALGYGDVLRLEVAK